MIVIETDLDDLAESLDLAPALEREFAAGLGELAQQARARAPRRTGALAAGFEVSGVQRNGDLVEGTVENQVPYAGVVRRRKGAPLVADELVLDPAADVALDAVHRALDAIGAE